MKKGNPESGTLREFSIRFLLENVGDCATDTDTIIHRIDGDSGAFFQNLAERGNLSAVQIENQERCGYTTMFLTGNQFARVNLTSERTCRIEEETVELAELIHLILIYFVIIILSETHYDLVQSRKPCNYIGIRQPITSST